jgi:hypothetical protein
VTAKRETEAVKASNAKVALDRWDMLNYSSIEISTMIFIYGIVEVAGEGRKDREDFSNGNLVNPSSNCMSLGVLNDWHIPVCGDFGSINKLKQDTGPR